MTTSKFYFYFFKTKYYSKLISLFYTSSNPKTFIMKKPKSVRIIIKKNIYFQPLAGQVTVYCLI